MTVALTPVQKELSLAMTCCKYMKELTDNAGRAGISAVVKSEMGTTFFCLQSRATDSDAEEGVVSLLNSARMSLGSLPWTKGQVALVAQRGFKFCPGCGTDLTLWIKCNVDQINELAAQSKSFVR
ncbi:MAG: hypothetical protein SF187_18115 [Deltaproteobacteria bacterium]|nr:hypothetical protein [Deltaproteobacteria bacterium]